MLNYWKRLVEAVRFYNTGQPVDEDGESVGEPMPTPPRFHPEMRERGVRYPVPYFVTRYKEKAKRKWRDYKRGFSIPHVYIQDLDGWEKLKERPRNILARQGIDTMAKLVDLGYADMLDIGLSHNCIENIDDSGILNMIHVHYLSEIIDVRTYTERFYEKPWRKVDF